MGIAQRREFLSAACAFFALIVIFDDNRCFSQQPTAVSVALPVETESADFEFAGVLEPAKQADVRAAATGKVRKVLVKNGDTVNEGDVLVQLDDDALKEQIKSASEETDRLKAQLEKLDAQVADEFKKLGDQKPDAEQTARITAARDLVAANLQIQELELHQLRDDLEATNITAPLPGRVSGLSLQPGDPVHASGVAATLVCKLTQTDPVRACFTVDQTNVDALRKLWRASSGEQSVLEPSPFGRGQGEGATGSPHSHPRPGPLPEGEEVAIKPDLVSMAVGDETDFKHRGMLDYVSAHANQQTGQTRVCALFPNADGKLDAAAHAKKPEDRAVRIRFAFPRPRRVLLVSNLAVGRDHDRGDIVLAVNDRNQIEVCPVTLGPQHQGMQVIESGLEPDQWVVIGTPAAKLNPMSQPHSPIDFRADLRFGNLRPGATVQPVKVPMPRPGRTLRDKTRDEAKTQNLAK